VEISKFQPAFENTMQSFPRALSGLGRSNAAWTCSACTKALRQPSKTGFFNSSMSRKISNTSKPRQNVAPTMEQLREPFKKKNSSTMYYTLSIILGTVAFSYGSVPMYKMVCCRRQLPPPIELLLSMVLDLSNNRLGRSAHQSSRSWWSRWRGSLRPPPTCYFFKAHTRYLQRVRLGCPAVEICAPTTRGQSTSW